LDLLPGYSHVLIDFPQKSQKSLDFGIVPLCEAYDNKEYGYFFSWNDIPGNDNKRLIGFLKKIFDFKWADNARIEKIDDDKTIRLFFENNFISLKLNDDKTKVILKIDDVRSYELIAKTEKDKINIYEYGIFSDKKDAKSTAYNIISIYRDVLKDYNKIAQMKDDPKKFENAVQIIQKVKKILINKEYQNGKILGESIEIEKELDMIIENLKTHNLSFSQD
jgi:hypothetical protein